MSSDVPTASPGRSARRRTRRFRGTLTATLAVLALATAGLSVAGVMRGPQVRDVEMNRAALVERPGQRIVITADQRLASTSAADITMTPEAPLSATVEGDSVTVTLDAMLEYGQTYEIELPRLVGADTGSAAAQSYTFTTPDPFVYTLQRDPGGEDVLLRQRLTGGGSPEEVYASQGIEEYGVLSTSVAVSRRTADQGTAVTIIGTDVNSGDLLLDPSGTVRQLRGSGATNLLGFAFTGLYRGEALENALLIYDMQAATGVPEPVTGLDGAPLQVADWLFVPGTSSIVAQGDDQSLYLVDAAARTVTSPLGRHIELRGFLPGTTQLVVKDPEDYSLLDLAESSVATVAFPEADPSVGTYPGPHIPVADGVSAQVLTTPLGDAPGRFAATLAVTDASGTRVAFEPPVPGSRILNVCVSPNGRVAAVETVPERAEPDGYAIVLGYAGVGTTFIDLATGSTVRTAYGFQPDWCS